MTPKRNLLNLQTYFNRHRTHSALGRGKLTDLASTLRNSQLHGIIFPLRPIAMVYISSHSGLISYTPGTRCLVDYGSAHGI